MTKYLVRYVKWGEGRNAVGTWCDVLPFQFDEWHKVLETKIWRGKRIIIKGIYKVGKDDFDLTEVDHI